MAILAFALLGVDGIRPFHVHPEVDCLVAAAVRAIFLW
jgi:hypothetical protein